MIPAIAFMLAAYMIPRLLIATMDIYRNAPPSKSPAGIFAVLFCVVGIGGIIVGFLAVVFSGTSVPRL